MKTLKMNLLEKEQMNEVRGGAAPGSSVHWCSGCPCGRKEGRVIAYGRVDAAEQKPKPVVVVK